jgi:peptide/nickel transport system substrate-binding protein
MNRPTRAIAAVGTATALILLAGCFAGGADAPADATAAPGTDTVRATIIVPATFNPVMSQSLPDYQLARMSYDTLVRRDAGGLVAGLASSWTSTPLRAELTIREGATCSEGTPITPTIVRDSLQNFATAEGGGVNAAEVFGTGNSPVITADDGAGTVTIDLQTPWPHLTSGLALSSTGIICPAGLADPQGLNAGTVKGAESGPYVLESFEPGIRYTFRLRDDYDWWPEWTTEVPGRPAETIEYMVSPDSTATANLVISGQLDIALIQAQTIERFEGSQDYELVTQPFSDYYLVFNEREGSPFASEAIRRGVTRAVDREMFSKVTSLGIGEIATSLVSKSNACVPSENPLIPAADPAEAAAVLDGVTIRFVAPTVVGPAGAGNEYIAEALRAAGATVQLENVDVGTWIARVLGEPDAWDLTLFADLNFLGSIASTVDSFVGPRVEDGGANFSGVSNPEAEENFRASLSSTTEGQGCGYIKAAVDALIARADVLPLINDPQTHVVRPGFSYQMVGGALDDPIYRIRD